jgi:hypothetical protein
MMTLATLTARRPSASAATMPVVRQGAWAICAFSGPSRLSLGGLDYAPHTAKNSEGQKEGPGG